MSHLICAATVRAWRDPADAHSILRAPRERGGVAREGLGHYYPSHVPGFCPQTSLERVSVTHQAANLRGQRRAQERSVRNIRQKVPPEDALIHIYMLRSPGLIKCGASVAAFLNGCFDPAHAGRRGGVRGRRIDSKWLPTSSRSLNGPVRMPHQPEREDDLTAPKSQPRAFVVASGNGTSGGNFKTEEGK